MKRVGTQLREAVIIRAQGYCEYCLCPMNVSPDPFAVEHIRPKSLGGDNSPGNLAFSCNGCNNTKYNKVEAIDPVTATLVRLYNPREDRWEDHFAWNTETTHIVGLSAIGRATVNLLQLNREGVVNLRELLLNSGRHPITQLRKAD